MPVVRVLAETGGDAMKILDLFAGLGGFSLAAHWLGWETAAFVEKEPFCQKVLAKNFPEVPLFDDIFEFSYDKFKEHIWQTQISNKEVMPEAVNRLYSIDIVTGGFP